MKYLLYFFLGYCEIEISSACVKEILNFCNNESVSLLALKVDSDTAHIQIKAADEGKLSAFFNSCCIGFTIKKRRGLPPLVKKYRHRAGIISGTALFFFILYLSPLFIWEINITGLETLSQEYVLELLSKNGVSIGVFSPSIDRQAVYSNVLRESADISWISVNIRGSSANVEIIERDHSKVLNFSADGANIVAAKDGLIVDADIINGRRVANNGEIVKKGALLVSGVYDSVKMGTRFVYAEAAVYATVNDRYTVEIHLNNTKRVYDEDIVLEKSIILFGKSVNISKNYSKDINNYDIIIRKDSMPFLGLGELPIVIENVCALPFEDVPVTLTESEALDKARRETEDKLRDAEYTELISKEESYYFENAVLYYSCSVEAIQNIAEVSEFSID